MPRIEITDLPVDEELTRRETKELFGGGEPPESFFQPSDPRDRRGKDTLDGTYTLNSNTLNASYDLRQNETV